MSIRKMRNIGEIKIDIQGRAIIKVEDYPDIDPDTDEGKEEFLHVACSIHWQHPEQRHFVIRKNGEDIGEMIFGPADKKHEH